MGNMTCTQNCQQGRTCDCTDLVARLRQPGDEVVSARWKSQVLNEIERLRDELAECREDAGLSNLRHITAYDKLRAAVAIATETLAKINANSDCPYASNLAEVALEMMKEHPHA